MAQVRLCYYLRSKALREGKTPTWDCDEMKEGTNFRRLPERLSSSGRRWRQIRSQDSSRRQRRRQRVSSSRRKVHFGPHGGRYRIYRGQKVYI